MLKSQKFVKTKVLNRGTIGYRRFMFLENDRLAQRNQLPVYDCSWWDCYESCHIHVEMLRLKYSNFFTD